MTFVLSMGDLPSARAEDPVKPAPAHPASSDADASRSVMETVEDTIGVNWDFDWDAGLNYEIRRAYKIHGPDGIVQKVLGEEASLRGHIGGKLAIDGAGFTGRGRLAEEADNGFEVRRARIYTTGDFVLGLPLSFKFEFQYQGPGSEGSGLGSFTLFENWLAYRNIPYLGTLYVGNIQTPVGLEGIASARDLTFMEPASPVEAFAPGIKAGIMLTRPVLDGRATWSVGAFANNASEDFGNRSDMANVDGRVTWLPVYRAEGASTKALVHLGLSASFQFNDEGTVRYRSRPESHLAPFAVDTKDMDSSRSSLVGVELAMVRGPLSAQAEFYHSAVDPGRGGIRSFFGAYAEVSWFITGESRPYDTEAGVFARLKPLQKYSFPLGGLGAWQVALRYSYLDLEDGPVHGGVSNIVTAGVNWYLNRYMKLRFNYGFAAVGRRDGGGNLNIFQSRLEVDF